MIRRNDWEQALSDYLAGHREAVFAWGRMDCALFAAGAVKAMTGTDPLAGAGRWKSQAGAARAIRRAGFASLEQGVSSLLQPVEPVFAMRGDLVMAEGALGICAGAQAWFLAEGDGAAGLAARPMAAWSHAWRVPFQG